MNTDLPLSSNGPAYRKTEEREGVPLDYVAEKLAVALRSLHQHARDLVQALPKEVAESDQSDRLPIRVYDALHKLVVAFLALHNMLASAGNPALVARLLAKSPEELSIWIDTVERGGSVSGIHL